MVPCILSMWESSYNTSTLVCATHFFALTGFHKSSSTNGWPMQYLDSWKEGSIEGKYHTTYGKDWSAAERTSWYYRRGCKTWTCEIITAAAVKHERVRLKLFVENWRPPRLATKQKWHSRRRRLLSSKVPRKRVATLKTFTSSSASKK